MAEYSITKRKPTVSPSHQVMGAVKDEILRMKRDLQIDLTFALNHNTRLKADPFFLQITAQNLSVKKVVQVYVTHQDKLPVLLGQEMGGCISTAIEYTESLQKTLGIALDPKEENNRFRLYAIIEAQKLILVLINETFSLVRTPREPENFHEIMSRFIKKLDELVTREQDLINFAKGILTKKS